MKGWVDFTSFLTNDYDKILTNLWPGYSGQATSRWKNRWIPEEDAERFPDVMK